MWSIDNNIAHKYFCCNIIGPFGKIKHKINHQATKPQKKHLTLISN